MTTEIIDLAGGNKVFDRAMFLSRYSVQAVWQTVIGTFNGTILLQQSNDGTHWDQIKTIKGDGTEINFGIDINSANGSATIEDKIGFTGVYLRISISVMNITGGKLIILFNTLL